MTCRMAFLALLTAAAIGFVAPVLADQMATELNQFENDDSSSRSITETEAAQERIVTNLLNQLTRQGLVDLRTIRREGSDYVVEMVDRELRLRTFRLKLDSRTIIEIY